MSEIASIVYKPKGAPPSEEGYTRIPLAEARLVAGHGIEDDAKGGGTERHLNIMCAETLQGLAAEGFRTTPGAMGEQIIVAGLDVDALPEGTRLQLGATARVELVKPRTGCAVFERHQSLSPQQAAGRMGMIAKVLEGGVIRVGDPVKALEK